MKFLYATEIDLSIDNGPGINERGFIDILITYYSQEVVCIAPFPQNPEVYYDQRMEYIYGHNRYNPFRYALFLISAFWRIKCLHARYKFDGMVFRLGEIPIIPCIFHYFFRVPIILKTLAGYTLFEQKDKTLKLKLVAKVLFPIYKMAVKKALAADTVSPVYVDWISWKYGIAKKKVSVIQNGADVHFFRARDKIRCKRELGLEQFDKLVGYVGALAPLRSLDVLIECMKKFKKIKNLALVLVGDGNQRGDLEDLVRSEDLGDRVIFTGFVPYKMVPKYISSFDVAVDLSLVPMKIEGKVYYASYSQKIPQYLACGVPVVAWESPDTQFIADNNLGRLAVPGNIDSLENEIMGMCSLGEEELSEIRERNLQWVGKYLSTAALAKKRVRFWKSTISCLKAAQYV